MASHFDGMGEILSGIFGDAVTYQPQAGVLRPVQSIFRSEPVEAVDEGGGPVILSMPTWRVRRDLVPEVARGDLITAPNGLSYRITAVRPPASPAVDAFVICELKREAS